MRRTRPLATLAAAFAGAVGVVGLSAPSSAAAPVAPTPPVVAAPGATPVVPAPGRPVPGSYLVTLAEGVEPRGFARALQISPRYVYSSAVNGFAGPLTAGQLRALERSPQVVRIEEDQVVMAIADPSAAAEAGASATQEVASKSGLYGLDRVDQRTLPLSGSYHYHATAPAVRAYVIDTGIATRHPDFEGRASNVYDALGGNGQDCNGHGTHVAGTIGGQRYGLAKDARLRGVRVLGCNGSGSTSGIVAAVDWVRRNAIKPAVANLSLGGGYSSTLNTAVTNLASAGVSVAVAAGNENANACNVSPASASGVITVAASDRTDTRASFSNYGSCVEIYAPGVGVTSTWLNSGTKTISGTSMASPHVAGVMALYKASSDKASSTVNTWIVTNATSGLVRSNPSKTANRLLYKSNL